MRSVFLAVLAVLQVTTVQAENLLAGSLTDPQIQQLSENPTWRRLLHITKLEAKGFQTDIKSEGFYIAHIKEPNPRLELIATVSYFLSSNRINFEPNQNPICLYPARYLWLKRQIPSLFANLKSPNCPGLSSWFDLSKKFKIHIVHVSGYFANPASAFGHLLLRISDASRLSDRGLLDLGVNFGARIPPKENPVAYIVKGLFGGYTASFSNKDNYIQDQVYSAIESRDMWAYELNLSEFQIQMLIYHLWELSNVEFAYFFLKENCAYRLAELLELVLDTNILPENQPYYPPIDVFFSLSKIDNLRGNSLISQIRFIPSQQRLVYDAYRRLPDVEAGLATRFVKTEDLQILSSQSSSQLLNFLLSYYDYKIIKQSQIERDKNKRLRNKILQLRFEQPLDEVDTSTKVNELKPPGEGLKAKVFGMELGHTQENQALGLFKFSPFSFDILNNNRGSLIDGSFKVFELRLAVEKQRLKLDSLNLISIQKLTTNSINIRDESSYIWRGRLALESNHTRCHQCIRPIFDGGIGSSISFKSVIAYLMLDIETELSYPDVQVFMSVGGVWRPTKNLSSSWESGRKVESTLDEGLVWRHQLAVQHKIGKNNAVQLYYKKEGQSVLSAGFTTRW